MNLSVLLDSKNVILNLNIRSKKLLIEFFANRLATNNSDVNEDDVIKGVYQREKIGSTYIGKNIYVPHCRVVGLKTTKITIIKLKKSYYDDLIKDDIKIVVGVFFPHKISDVHVKLIKDLASYLKRDTMQKHFKQVKSSEELYKLIIQGYDEEKSD